MPPPGARLVVHDAISRRVVPIEAPLVTIGRDESNTLQIAGPEVSRDHADILTTPDGYLLRDRGSRHGVFVNGSRVREHRLVAGDRIECGRSGAVLLFLLGETRAPGDEAPAAGPGDLRQVAVLLDALREMGSDRVLDEVLVMVLDSAIAATGAERGVILLAEDGVLETRLARGAGAVTLASDSVAMSRKIPDDVFASGLIAVVPDLLEGGTAAAHSGTIALGIRHVLCAPLRLVRYMERSSLAGGRRNIGVLYLDSPEKGRILASSARTALEALAGEAALAIENARLYQEGLEKARLDDELKVASRIQQTLLPEARRAGPFFEVVGASSPSRAIGGDFFDYQALPDGRLGFGLGDVTGKGPPAALLTSLAQGVLAARAPELSSGPRDVVLLLNRILLARRVEAKFLTLFLAALAPDGTLTYCNAGHNPPLVFTAGGVHRLDAGGTLIGAFPDAEYEQAQVLLAPGDTLVAFSDGVSEAFDRAGEEFGEARVRDAVVAAMREPPAGVLRALMDAVLVFTGVAGPHDDVTALVLRYLAPPP